MGMSHSARAWEGGTKAPTQDPKLVQGGGEA